MQGQPGIRTVVPDEASKYAPIDFNACGVAGRDDAYATPTRPILFRMATHPFRCQTEHAKVGVRFSRRHLRSMSPKLPKLHWT